MADVEAAVASQANPLTKMFGPDVWTRMATNPKLKPYLDQPDVVQKIQAIQANPASVNMYMSVGSFL